ncbi:MAG: AEC family transporter, partial [Pyramidobacter sp.]|nr:AEC family transporter [Pyramidobacter sp.]
KMPPARRAVSMLTGVRPNAVFIGLPVMTLWLGQAGTEAHLLCIAVGTPYFNVIPLLLAQIALNGKADMKSVRDAFLKTFQNRILLAGLFGLFLGAMGWTPYIPQWVMRTLNVLGNCGNGLAMLAIGAALHPERLLDDVKIAWPDMLMKLFIHPAIIMAAFMLFPAGSPVLLRVTVVGAAVAPAFNCFILARGFGMDGDYAAMLVASSTLLCMGTLLFWMELTTRVFV